MNIKDFENHVGKTFRGESYDRIIAGLAEELGEIAQITKHLKNSGPNREQEDQLALEIGDLIRYAAMLAVKSSVSLEEIIFVNMKKIELRYPKYFRTDVHISGQENDTIITKG